MPELVSLHRPKAVLLGHGAVLSRLCAPFTASVETGLSSVLLFEPTSQERGDGRGGKKKKRRSVPSQLVNPPSAVVLQANS